MAVFVWVYFDAEGRQAGRSERFEDQVEAEAWMGERWSALRDDGMETVALRDEAANRDVYRMGLSEEPEA